MQITPTSDAKTSVVVTDAITTAIKTMISKNAVRSLVTKRRNSWACRGKPNPEQETIKGTHAQETSAYQRRPTTQYAAQGSNPPIGALHMQLAKIPHTHTCVFGYTRILLQEGVPDVSWRCGAFIGSTGEGVQNLRISRTTKPAGLGCSYSVGEQ